MIISCILFVDIFIRFYSIINMYFYLVICFCGVFFFFKQKTAYEMRISDWSSDVCSSDLGFPMRVNRAYVDGTLAVGARVALPEDAAAHLLRVLRLDVGDGCVLFNGDGHDYDARVVAAGKRGGE